MRGAARNRARLSEPHRAERQEFGSNRRDIGAWSSEQDDEGYVGLTATLHAIAKRAGLDRRDGHPLWAYKLSNSEYEELRAELRAAFDRGDHRSTVVAAAFCMVAARHFCRTHEGGAWSWAPILEETGCPHPVSSPRLTELVEDGLRYWGIREVLSTEDRRYFHRTLVCQGGLPLKLLTRGDTNNLQQFFWRLLRASEQYDQRPAELAPALGTGLPHTLRNEIVYQMASELVAAIAELRKRLALPCIDPVAELDRLEPEWRSRIPLEVGDEIATELLKGLLNERAPREQSSERSIVEIVLSLQLNGEPRLVRSARIAAATSETELRKLLRVKDELPPYFQLSLLLPDGTRRPVASVHRVQESPTFRLAPELPERPIRRGAGLLGAVRIIASVGESDLGVGDVPGGQPIPAELPWVLRGSQLHDEIPVRAVGSARAAGESMLLLLPDGAALSLDDGARVEPLNQQSPKEYQLVRLHGSASFSNADGDSCRFATGRDEEQVAFRLAGQLQRFAFSGSEVWRGPPTVLRVLDERERAVPSESIEWKPRGRAGAWHPWTRSPLGDVALRVVEDGETVFRTFATIIPPSLGIELKKLVHGQGAVALQHRDLRSVHVCDEHLQWEAVDYGGGRFEVCVNGTENLVPALSLRLLFRDACEATLQVPCPIELRAFVGFDGSSLPSGTVRAVDRLGGVRAVAVLPRPEDVLLQARLQGRRWRVIGELVRQSDEGRVYELSLDRVQSAVATLLAGSADLDAVVELRIVNKGILKGPQPTLCACRYDTKLEPTRDEERRVVEVHLDQGAASVLGGDTRGLLRVDCRSLDRLGEPVTLKEMTPGSWILPWDEMTHGPWLIVGWQGEWARLRPLLVTKPGGNGAELDRLQRAIRTYPEEVRGAAIAELLGALEGEIDAPEWRGLHAMAGTLGELPAMTFDVIREIARHPLSAALLAVQTGARESMWTGFEELPFLWAALPVRAWLQAIRRTGEWAASNEALCEVLGGPNAASQKTLEPFFQHATLRARFMAPVHELVARVMPGVPEVPGNPLLQSPGLFDRLMKVGSEPMLRRNSGRRWPNPGLSDLVQSDVWSFMREYARLEARRGHQHAVFNAPAVVAAASVLDVPLTEEALFEIRLVRDFDREWFGFAHALSLTRLLAHQLTENPEMYDDVR